MAAVSEERRRLTLEDLMERFGPMPAHRIRTVPAPGLATEKDLIEVTTSDERLWELVDGVLLEKPMGCFESRLAAVLVYLISRFLEEHDLGIVLGADAASRFAPGLVRVPDVSFVCWDRLPGRKTPREPIPDLVPDLAVEVLSESNTPQEMERKLRDYFQAGVRLVWYVEPISASVRAYTSLTDSVRIDGDQSLEGGAVLPGFSIPLREWFARADRSGGGGAVTRS